MPKKNTTIAILTSDRTDLYKDIGAHLIRHEYFLQDFQALPATLNADDNNLHLVIDGGHGLANTHTGAPLSLNNQSVASIKRQIQSLKDKGLLFQSISLTSCFSASFVPLFKELLTDEGIIFCQTLSSTAPADRLLAEAESQEHDLFSLGFAVLSKKVRATLDQCQEMLSHTQCFVSDAIYTKQNDTLHRFKFKNLNKALHAHNKIINAGNQKDCKHELDAVEAYLEAHGINISDDSIDADEMEGKIREICFRFRMHPLKRNHFNDIEILDARIFPADARQIDLDTCYHEKYSWLMTDSTQSEKIIGYIFAKPVGKDELFIGNLGVDPNIGPHGIGSKLLKKMLTQAHQEQKTVRLEVQENNTRAINLYKKLGFIQTGTNQDHIVMSHKPKAFKPQISTSSSNTDNNTPHYSFLLKLAVFSLSVCLLLVAAVFFPPLGLAPILGIKAIAGMGTNISYAISGISAAAGFASLGFFGYMLGKDSAKPTPNNQPDTLST